MERLNAKNLAIGIVIIFSVLMTAVTLYNWITAVFAKINPIAVVAAVGVAVAGFAWFKRTTKNH